MTNRVGVFWEERREAVLGWSFSLLFHGVVGTAAILMMTNVSMLQKPEPFRLNMSILKPPLQPVIRPQSVQETPVAQRVPVKQQKVHEQRTDRATVQKQVVKKTKTLESPIPQHQTIAARPVRQVTPANPVTRAVNTREPVEQKPITDPRLEQTPTVQQVVQTQKSLDAPVPEHRVIASQPVERKASLTSVKKRLAAQVQPKASQREVSAVPQPMLMTDRHLKKQSAVQQVEVVSRNETKPTSHMVETVSPKFKNISAIVTGSISRSAPSFRKPLTQAHVATHSAPPVQTRTPSIQPPSRQVIQKPIVTKVQPSVVTRAQPSVVARLVKQYPSATTDYRWVANTLLEKVQKIKRYPSRAKRREWEGTVELRVSIRDNGEIQDVHVLVSSGHKILDQEALKTVKMASPLTLNYPLDRSIVLVDLPLMYKLN